MCVYTYTFTYIHTCVYNMCVYIYVCIYIYTHVCRLHAYMDTYSYGLRQGG